MFSVNGILHSFFQPKRELQIIFSIKIIFRVINVTKHPFKRAYFLTLIEKLHLPKHKVILKSVSAMHLCIKAVLIPQVLSNYVNSVYEKRLACHIACTNATNLVNSADCLLSCLINFCDSLNLCWVTEETWFRRIKVAHNPDSLIFLSGAVLQCPPRILCIFVVALCLLSFKTCRKKLWDWFFAGVNVSKLSAREHLEKSMFRV